MPRTLLTPCALLCLAAALGCGEDGARTPGSLGALLLTDVDKFSGGYQPAVKALGEHLETTLDLDPGEYYVALIIDPYTNVFTFILWHRIAFEPKYARESNPGGKCFTITYDPKSGMFGTPEYWP
ncbi:MAG: hypothetical protein ACYTAN_11275 [Planctomycetota bacterium]|jgi:hypothetical protein